MSLDENVIVGTANHATLHSSANVLVNNHENRLATAEQTIASFRSLSYTTAGRPIASAVNVGTAIFNTTTNKPNWSNGTNWVDATGTIV